MAGSVRTRKRMSPQSEAQATSAEGEEEEESRATSASAPRSSATDSRWRRQGQRWLRRGFQSGRRDNTRCLPSFPNFPILRGFWPTGYFDNRNAALRTSCRASREPTTALEVRVHADHLPPGRMRCLRDRNTVKPQLVQAQAIFLVGRPGMDDDSELAVASCAARPKEGAHSHRRARARS